jgi:hypothetical protein
VSNRLATEQSPYLRQHAENPVDWFPWGEAAFARSRDEDKPIFLSIGYSTCHWCHVMAHESFESDELAARLNAHFVSIKVDREERPDVDRVYMTFVQATTGSGGWPMSVWLTPDLKPFYGGTYFPPSSRWGRPGFAEVLDEIARAWTQDRGRIERSAESMVGQLRQARSRLPGGASAVPSADALGQGVAAYQGSFDARRGGFGGAPKFPRPSELLFLLREHVRTGSTPARDMVVQTLRAMALGGMRDHVGGGFHRYSVDAEWRVPHFEKMLYDQAQLVLAYLEAAQLTGDGFFATVAEDTLAYVDRELSDPAGGFYSAEDADSVPPEQAERGDPHTTEGAFYVWADAEIAALVGHDVDVARARFDVRPDGNAPHDPQAEFTGKNLLYTARSIEDVARETGRGADEVVSALGRIRRALFEARARRPRPHLDDKVLTAWNGLMIAALARAARVLATGATGSSQARRAAGYVARARAAASFIRARLWNGESRSLLRRFRAGDAAIDAYCEDFASLIWGLVELFQADPDPVWLDWALELQRRQDELFWDPVDHGWFSTTGEDPSVLLRLKEDYDGAEPSAGAMSLLNVLALVHWTDDPALLQRLEQGLARLGDDVATLARAMPLALSALSAYHAGIGQIVIVGKRDASDTLALQRAIAGRFLPFAVVLLVEPGAHQSAVAERLPFVTGMTERDGEATAYICRNFTCEEPITDAETLARRLGEPAR